MSLMPFLGVFLPRLGSLVATQAAFFWVVVQTFGNQLRNSQEHEPAQAARTAFHISGAVLFLIRSLPSL
ncbi:hypothetical protein, partial [Methylocella tundrae]|uniref:hypothetical protein n=1 Tax=Methylocella tundrae TaxID=227605 RepID=UPI001AEF1417